MTTSIDSKGRCAAHPFVQLKLRSKRTGEWKALLEACPLCTMENSVNEKFPLAGLTPLQSDQMMDQEKPREGGYGDKKEGLGKVDNGKGRSRSFHGHARDRGDGRAPPADSEAGGGQRRSKSFHERLRIRINQRGLSAGRPSPRPKDNSLDSRNHHQSTRPPPKAASLDSRRSYQSRSPERSDANLSPQGDGGRRRSKERSTSEKRSIPRKETSLDNGRPRRSHSKSCESLHSKKTKTKGKKKLLQSWSAGISLNVGGGQDRAHPVPKENQSDVSSPATQEPTPKKQHANQQPLQTDAGPRTRTGSLTPGPPLARRNTVGGAGRGTDTFPPPPSRGTSPGRRQSPSRSNTFPPPPSRGNSPGRGPSPSRSNSAGRAESGLDAFPPPPPRGNSPGRGTSPSRSNSAGRSGRLFPPPPPPPPSPFRPYTLSLDNIARGSTKTTDKVVVTTKPGNEGSISTLSHSMQSAPTIDVNGRGHVDEASTSHGLPPPPPVATGGSPSENSEKGSNSNCAAKDRNGDNVKDADAMNQHTMSSPAILSSLENNPFNLANMVNTAEFDSKGRCIRHPHVKLRKKKLLGGWKVIMSACPDCCVEELKRMWCLEENRRRMRESKEWDERRERGRSRGRGTSPPSLDANHPRRLSRGSVGENAERGWSGGRVPSSPSPAGSRRSRLSRGSVGEREEKGPSGVRVTSSPSPAASRRSRSSRGSMGERGERGQPSGRGTGSTSPAASRPSRSSRGSMGQGAERGQSSSRGTRSRSPAASHHRRSSRDSRGERTERGLSSGRGVSSPSPAASRRSRSSRSSGEEKAERARSNDRGTSLPSSSASRRSRSSRGSRRETAETGWSNGQGMSSPSPAVSRRTRSSRISGEDMVKRERSSVRGTSSLSPAASCRSRSSRGSRGERERSNAQVIKSPSPDASRHRRSSRGSSRGSHGRSQGRSRSSSPCLGHSMWSDNSSRHRKKEDPPAWTHQLHEERAERRRSSRRDTSSPSPDANRRRSLSDGSRVERAERRGSSGRGTSSLSPAESRLSRSSHSPVEERSQRGWSSDRGASPSSSAASRQSRLSRGSGGETTEWGRSSGRDTSSPSPAASRRSRSSRRSRERGQSSGRGNSSPSPEENRRRRTSRNSSWDSGSSSPVRSGSSNNMSPDNTARRHSLSSDIPYKKPWTQFPFRSLDTSDTTVSLTMSSGGSLIHSLSSAGGSLMPFVDDGGASGPGCDTREKKEDPPDLTTQPRHQLPHRKETSSSHQQRRSILVRDMRWTDPKDNRVGTYTGEVNYKLVPDGPGELRYDGGEMREGEWVEGWYRGKTSGSEHTNRSKTHDAGHDEWSPSLRQQAWMRAWNIDFGGRQI